MLRSGIDRGLVFKMTVVRLRKVDVKGPVMFQCLTQWLNYRGFTNNNIRHTVSHGVSVC